MAKALKIAGAVVAVAGLAIITGGLAAGASLSFIMSAGFGVGSLTVGGLMAVGAALNTAGSLLSPKPKAPATSEANANRLTVSMDLRAFRKTVLGSTAFATDLRDQEWSADQSVLHRFIVCASHRVQAIREIWFDDKLAWTVTGGVQAPYVGYLDVTPVLEGSAANAINIGSRMGASRRFTGCAYVYLRYKLTGNGKKAESPFASSIPSRVTIVGDGAYFYDPRLDSTVPGGSGQMRADDQRTWAWNPAFCRNPALGLLFYLLGWRIQNPATGEWKLAIGKGIPASRIDLPSFITAANLCEEPVTRADGTVEPRYRADGIYSEGDDPSLVLDNLKAAMNAVLDDADGKIRVTVLHNDLSSPIGDLTTADVLGEFTWLQTPPLTDSVNVIRGGYIDPSPTSLYQLVDLPEVSIPSPDGIDRPQTVNLALVQSPGQGQRLFKLRLGRAQYGGTYTAVFQATAWKYQKGDVIRFSFSPLGWDKKLFRIADVATQVDGTVPMMLREEHPAIYAAYSDERAAITAAAPTSYDPTLWPVIQGIVDAGTTAEWSGVAGPGKPADNADVTAENIAKDTAAVGGRPSPQITAAIDASKVAIEQAQTDLGSAKASLASDIATVRDETGRVRQDLTDAVGVVRTDAAAARKEAATAFGEAATARGEVATVRIDVGTVRSDVATARSEAATVASNLSSEIDRAKGAEGTLTTKVQQAQGRADAAYSAVTDETVNRAAADSAIAGRVSTTEAQLRGDQDSTIAGRIRDEAAARANQDGALAGRISTTEAQLRGDQDSAIAGRIRDEAATRANQDGALAGRISTTEAKMTRTPDVFRIRAAGNSAHNSPFGLTSGIFRPGDTDFINIGRSYGVIAFEQNANVINYAETFDVYGSPDRAQQMADVLMNIAPGRTVIVISNDEPAGNRFVRGLDAAMARVGAGEDFFSPRFKVRGAYILVGSGGAGRGRGVEFSKGTVDNDLDAFLEVMVPMLAGRPALGSNGGAASVRAAVDDEAVARANQDGALAGRISTTEAQLRGDQDSTIAARIRDEAAARANQDGALAGRISTTEAQLRGDQDSTIAARIRDEAATRASQDGAIAGRTAAIEASYTAGGNLLTNTALEQSTAGWFWAIPNSNWTFARADLTDPIWWPVNVTPMVIRQYGNEQHNAWWYQDVPVLGDAWYQQSVYAASHRCPAILYIDWYDGADNNIDADSKAIQHYQDQRRLLSSYVRLFQNVQAPPNAVRARVYFGKGATSESDNSFGWLALPQFVQSRQGVTQAIPYTPGSAVAEMVSTNARVTDEAATRASQDGALAGRITTTEAQLRGDQDSTIAARIRDEAATRASLDGALAGRVSTTEAQLRGDQDSTIAARIRDEAAARANQDGALAGRISTTEAKLTRAPEVFRVQSAGNVATQSPFGRGSHMYRPDGSLLHAGGRSYSVVTFPAGSNVADYANNFDVYGDDNARAQMADKLNSIPAGKTVIIFTSDEPNAFRFNRGLDTAMARVGAGESFFSPKFKGWSSYILVGRAGIGRGRGLEYYVGEIDQDPNAFQDIGIPMLDGRPIVGSPGGVQQLRAAVDDEVTTRANQDGALAGRISTTEAQLRGDQDSTIAARIRDEAAARANQDGALAGRISTTEAQLRGDQDSTIAARIRDEAAARANQDGALAGRISTTEAQLRGDQDSTIAGRIRDEAAARANQDGALAGRISTTEAKMTRTPDVFRVRAAGNSAANSPFGQTSGIFRPGDTDYISIGRSYGVIAFEQNANVINYAETFDVYGSPDRAQHMANVLMNIAPGRTVIVISNDEPAYNRFVNGLDAAMARVGAGEDYFSPRFRGRACYILVGSGGAGRGRGVEFYKGTVDNDLDAFLEVMVPMLAGCPALGSNGGAASVRAAVDDEAVARANQDGALAGRISTTEAQLRGDQDSTIAARIRDEAAARASQDGAIAGRISTTEAQLRGDQDSAIAARIRDEAATRASQDSAMSSRISSTEARAGSLESRVQTSEGAIANVRDKVATAWAEKTASVPGAAATVRLVATDNNGNPTSQVALLADQIALVNKVNGAAIPALTVEGGNVMIANDLRGGAGRVIMDNGSVMKVMGTGFGSSNQFIEWFGPRKAKLTDCTEANATYYLKTDGSSYWGGSLSGGVVKNAVQTTSTASNASVTTGVVGSRGGQRVVVLSYSWLWQQSVNRTQAEASGSDLSARVVLSRNGTDVATLNATGEWFRQFSGGANEPGSYSESIGGSITFTDNSGGSSVTYDARLEVRNTGPGPQNGSSYAGVATQNISIVQTEQ